MKKPCFNKRLGRPYDFDLQVNTVGINDANIINRMEKNKNPALLRTFSALSPISR